jgi:hypothetical protein
MTVSPSEATEALRAIDAAQTRSARAYGYHSAAPHFFLWGPIWMIEYGGYYFDPRFGSVLSLLSIAGIAGSFWITRRAQGVPKPGFAWRYAATAIAIGAFASAYFAVFRPHSALEVGTFFPILVGFAYLLMGVWMRALRMAVLGAALIALTLAGYFWFPALFMLWMAIGGGGALLLGGFWFRSV